MCLYQKRLGQNKGTALGTLSLVRQVGLTLAPALYAGFITAGFDRIGDDIKNRLAKSGIPADQAQTPDIGGGLSSLQEQVSRIPVPAVKKAVSDAIEAGISSGYHHLYTAAAVISLCTIVSAAVLAFSGSRHPLRQMPAHPPGKLSNMGDVMFRVPDI
ncbi:hypothetical protein ACTWKC_00190 [Bacillus sp. 4A_MP3]